MLRQYSSKKRLCCVLITLCVTSTGVFLQASDLSEILWGGRGSRTTVSDPYVPPALATETPVVPVADSTVYTTSQTQLMLGSPDAITIPRGGVVASNGVATNGVVTSGYVVPNQVVTSSGVIPVVQTAPAQPTVDYEWSYSTIKDVSYEPVTVYDPRLGGYVTTYQEKQTESVLPWLHRKQVVRYKPTTDVPTIPAVSNTVVQPVSDTSQTRIVNRLFPVSTVPSPPVQAVPVQTIPLQPMSTTTYASEPITSATLLPGGSSQIQPASSTVMRTSGDLPVVPAVTIAQPVNTAGTMSTSPVVPAISGSPASTPIPSRLADLPPTLPDVVSPSAQQVLYPLGQANQTATQQPTLAPTRSEQAPATQENAVAQPLRLQDSLSATEKPHAVELPTGAALPLPTQPAGQPPETPAQTAPTETPPRSDTTNSGIPLLKPNDQSAATTSTPTPGSSQSVSRPATQTPSASGTRPPLSVSPTRMSPLSNN